MPRANWPDDEETVRSILSYRCQELVFIGIDMDRPAIIAMLDECLLSDSEMALGDGGWSAFPDPFAVGAESAAG